MSLGGRVTGSSAEEIKARLDSEFGLNHLTLNTLTLSFSVLSVGIQ